MTAVECATADISKGFAGCKRGVTTARGREEQQEEVRKQETFLKQEGGGKSLNCLN